MNLLPFNQMLEAAFAWTWKTSLQATVLIALVMAAQFMFKRMLAPRWRYALGLVILFRLVMPVVPSSSFSIFNLGNLPSPKPRTTSESTPVTVHESIPARPQSAIPMTANAGYAQQAEAASLVSVAKYTWICGCIGMLTMIARQHRKLAWEIRKQEPITDARVRHLLESCKARLGMKREVKVSITRTVNTPALFGNKHPCLLVPGDMLQQLEDRELRLIFLHELIHLKRGDILVNWFMILVRSLHWFNPAVWLALKRLRADQEMACDAAVMSHLAVGERRLYGNTLIKLAEGFSTAGLCSSLVPFITKKQIIKRRITMISKFKPAGRTALGGSLALIVALGCLTFTRASEGPKAPDEKKGQASTTTEPAQHTPISAGEVAVLRRELESYDEKIRIRQQTLDALRGKMNIPAEIASGSDTSDGLPAIKHYESIRIDAETQYIREATMLSVLKKLTGTELVQALSTTQSDPILDSLLQQQMAAETKLVGLKSEFGERSPDVLATTAVLNDLNKKIQDRTAGILAGMETKASSYKAVKENAEKMGEDAEAKARLLSEQSRPYFHLKRDLQTLQNVRDDMVVRLNNAELELSLSQPTTNH